MLHDYVHGNHIEHAFGHPDALVQSVQIGHPNKQEDDYHNQYEHTEFDLFNNILISNIVFERGEQVFLQKGDSGDDEISHVVQVLHVLRVDQPNLIVKGLFGISKGPNQFSAELGQRDDCCSQPLLKYSVLNTLALIDAPGVDLLNRKLAGVVKIDVIKQIHVSVKGSRKTVLGGSH